VVEQIDCLRTPNVCSAALAMPLHVVITEAKRSVAQTFWFLGLKMLSCMRITCPEFNAHLSHKDPIGL